MNAFGSVLMWWVKLEPITQSEVSQIQKNNYYIYIHTHIYTESRKMVLMNLFAEQQRRYQHKEQTSGQ